MCVRARVRVGVRLRTSFAGGFSTFFLGNDFALAGAAVVTLMGVLAAAAAGLRDVFLIGVLGRLCTALALLLPESAAECACVCVCVCVRACSREKGRIYL